MKQRIIIVTQYYKEKNYNNDYKIERQKEIDYCLVKNVENTQIDELHLLTEEQYTFDFIPPDKLRKIKQVVIGKRLTYKNAFDYYNEFLPNAICILMNADIYLDLSVEIVNYIDFKNLILAVNRYETNTCLLNGTTVNEREQSSCPFLEPYQPSVWSQDAWIWKTDKLILPDCDFQLGTPGCDNHIAYLFHINNFIVINPSFLICINHHDNLSIVINEYGTSKGNISKKKEKRIKSENEYLFLENISDVPDKYTTSTCENIDNFPAIKTSKFDKYISEVVLNNSQYVVSSCYDYCMTPSYCSFYSPNYWRPSMQDKNPYVQLNFENIREIVVLDIKGKSVDRNDNVFAYVIHFKISYMDTNEEWINIDKIFDCLHTKNGNHIRRVYLENPIVCVKMRIHPVNFHGMNTLKIKVYAVTYNKYDVFNYVSNVTNLTKNCKSSFMNYKSLLQHGICDVDTQIHEYNRNIIGESILEGVCLVTYVMNRKQNIQHNIDTWINQRVNQIIIVDWSSDEEFYELVANKKDDRILYVRVNNEKSFCRTYSENLAMSLCKYNKVCKIDSDIILYEKFFENHPLKHGEFYVGERLCGRDDNEKSTHGNVYLFLEDFFRINGYNEYIKGYGWDDSDLTIRLMLCGLEKKLFNMDLFYHVPHNNLLRTCNLTVKKHPEVLTQIHKYCLQEMNFWNRTNKRATYSISRKCENYISCERVIHDKLNVFDSKIYDSAYKKATLEVFQWYWNPNNKEHKSAVETLDYQFMETFLAKRI